MVGDDLEAQTRQAFANLGAALDALGATPSDVAKITTFVVNWSPDLRPALTAGRGEFFGDEPPASTLVGVQALATPALLVEVEATVVLPEPLILQQRFDRMRRQRPAAAEFRQLDHECEPGHRPTELLNEAHRRGRGAARRQ